MWSTQICRSCGATGLEPGEPKKKCGQCDGVGYMDLDAENPAGPGVKRLALAAKAANPQHKGPAMMIEWPRVKTRADRELIDAIREADGRRTRKQRRAWATLTRRAIRQGLLVPAVPEERAEA